VRNYAPWIRNYGYATSGTGVPEKMRVSQSSQQLIGAAAPTSVPDTSPAPWDCPSHKYVLKQFKRGCDVACAQQALYRWLGFTRVEVPHLREPITGTYREVSGGMRARSLSGGTPRSDGASRFFLPGLPGSATSTLGVTLSSCSTMFSRELWTNKLFPAP